MININLLASGSTDKMVKIWDIDGKSIKFDFKRHTDNVAALEWMNQMISGKKYNYFHILLLSHIF